ncbi:hypothetical protein JKG47_04365 [Acidithiobacillus sp. MC6.1]|nr:hypothetical protein [Acidithiobacillus sp. MC6.1]
MFKAPSTLFTLRLQNHNEEQDENYGKNVFNREQTGEVHRKPSSDDKTNNKKVSFDLVTSTVAG